MRYLWIFPFLQTGWIILAPFHRSIVWLTLQKIPASHKKSCCLDESVCFLKQLSTNWKIGQSDNLQWWARLELPTNFGQLQELFKQLSVFTTSSPWSLPSLSDASPNWTQFYLSICKLYLESVETNLITHQSFLRAVRGRNLNWSSSK